MTQPITITIKRTTPSGNKSTFGNRFDYVKERNMWYALLRAGLIPKQPPEHRVCVKIISYRVAICDRINHAAGCKPVLDGLKKLGYLKDDSIKWCDDTYEQFRVKRAEARTVVQIFNP